MAERRDVPVLPLRDTVIFPGPAVTIGVGRPASLKALEAATQADRTIFAVLERTDGEEPSLDSMHPMGVLARVGQVHMGLGALQVMLSGEQRATAVSYRTGPYAQAAVVPVQQIPPIDTDDPAFAGLFRETRERAIELGTQRGLSEEVLRGVIESVSEPGALADLVATYLEVSASEKQQLLETLSVEARLRRVLVHVQRDLQTLRAQQDIKEQVQQELGGRQREMYLREQLKAIRKELGEGDERGQDDELRSKLDGLELPEPVRAEVNRELERLRRAGPDSMDAQVIRTYLSWISELPWNRRSDDALDLTVAARVLDEDHYGLTDVKNRVLEFLSVRVLNARRARSFSEQERAKALARGPILLFIGPPGVGKTSIAQSIARALGRKYVRAAFGGVRDEADIRGHRRTYVGALPGRIIQGMKQAGTKNPVFLLDEVDKLGTSVMGDPSSALLEVLDPAQNDTFTDHYLGVPFDLSEVLFIATGNYIHRIPDPLLDRMEMVEFGGYTEGEKAQIAERYLIPRQLRESGLLGPEESLRFEPEAITLLVSEYTRESGVRQLEREIAAVTRKIARRVAGGEPLPGRVDAALVRALLGRPRVRSERAASHDEVGVATGMYYTPAGGDIMFVEASVRQRPGLPVTSESALGDVSLILTGQLGEVMRESARAALTYVTSHARDIGVPEARLGAMEVHVHVPTGAIPKDGPSAGVTIATALASAFSGRPARRDVAMTGEITLRGRVLPIGGLKEKVLGAHRAGIRHVIVPHGNADEIRDLPKEARSELEFHAVSSLDELLPLALVSE
ncbi:MAG TPA: endopeptidase La, partial [Polyangiaceae bacterium]